MKKIILIFAAAIIALTGFLFFKKSEIVNPVGETVKKIREKPFDKYTFANLRKTKFQSSGISMGRVLKNEDKIISQMFYYTVNGKKVSGLLNAPKASGKYPVILMFRGFVDKEIYETGVGTQRAGEVFAKNGFITLAPDFLGYGESDDASKNSIEDRFQTYTTVLTLFSSLTNLNSGLDASYSGKIKADESKVGIWAHSNGGQIALSALAISGKNFPTVLWAPVSKPFPYSILYYTDEFEDHGKALRKALADFENDYDVEKYSPSNFLDWINAFIQIHQGVNDNAVPVGWSDELYKKLKDIGKDISYFIYPNSDHNLVPDGWIQAVQRSMDFYKEKFGK